MPATVDTGSFRRGARERALAKLVHVRLLVAPVLTGVALTFALFEPTLWRRALLGCVISALVTISLVEFVRSRRQGLGAIAVPLNLVAMACGQIAVAVATGGLFSPIVPVLVIMTVVAAALVERPLLFAMVGGVMIPATWTMAVLHTRLDTGLVPELFGSAGALEHGPAPWIAASFYSLMLVGAVRLGQEVRSIFEALFDEALQERDRSLALHGEQNRALTTLSGEIAHELKNPLASVKGLSALIAKDVQGKTAERVAVLRREVDRMQGILDEFLNFSRPLVPLAIARTDLVELASDVVLLHEGTSSDRRVSIATDARAPVTIACDPRKVRQVLINLVQNALDASPPGGEVRVVVEDRSDEARVRVLDRGAGIDPEVADRLFEAGVTSKERGSGLGLAVARSLARQHGGELTLRAREGGGCEAELVLPHAAEEKA